jgi:hypothetical protein
MNYTTLMERLVYIPVVIKFKIRMYSYLISKDRSLPNPLAAQSKAKVCGPQLAGIEGSNSAGGMDLCLLRMTYYIC